MSSLRTFTGSGTLVHWWGTEGKERRGGRRERREEEGGRGGEKRKEEEGRRKEGEEERRGRRKRGGRRRERRREEEGGRGGRRERKRKEGEGEVKTGEGQHAVNETISTCCSLGPGLDALTVHHHLLPIYCDLGQPFIIRPHTVGEDLGQS